MSDSVKQFSFGGVSTQGSSDSKKVDGESVERVKVLIIGSGPAGYTAGIYASRADLKPVLYTGMEMGGQLTTTTEVENFPGYPDGIDGPSMMEDLKKQAERFGTDIRFGIVKSAELSTEKGGIHKIEVDGGKIIEAETVIISTGASAKYLGLESETRLRGYGISACATCDGFFYKGKDVAVVGGGDTAAEEATYLSKLCNKVTLVVRRDELRASKVMQARVLNTENIEVKWDSQIEEFLGENGVDGIRLVKKSGEKEDVKLDGVFIAIGHKPNSDFVKGQVDMDETGFINTTDGTKTNVPGVFAAGDVQDSKYRQGITAAGTGAMAAIDAEHYLASLED
ncbi:MAG: thioredoxin-disulfide reductase [Flavobacteriales bacterium]|nr:thioredoxin-disulfide reductase [Flavobacteriales bacterium]